MKLYAALFLGILILLLPGPAHGAGEQPQLDLDQLLQAVRQGRAHDSEVNRQRLADFRKDRTLQQQRLNELAAEEKRQEAISTEREKQFETNDQAIGDLQIRLNERLGSLKELFGVLQQVTGDAQGDFATSITQLHRPARSDYLIKFATKMGQTADLPSIAEIERLWYELQWEMTQSGKVVKLRLPVLGKDGQEREQELVRVGNFNLVSDGRYYQYVPETGRVVEFGRQPPRRYLQGAESLPASSEITPFTIDPTRGQLLALLVQAPDIRERIEQGGIIGYLIIGLGFIALVIALARLLVLTVVDRRIRAQRHRLEAPGRNPLGRVFRVYHEGKGWDTETLELKLGEAILRELPRINRGLSFLKIVAAVAPLMGLLGTVTGMIITFQAITLFGAGDPKLMAGGISQALVTTVLGLTVAIPTLLLHQLVQSRAKHINEVLEQEAVALVAIQAEG